MNPALMQMIAGQLRQPTTENVGTAQEPIWKVTVNGQGGVDEETLRIWQELLESTGAEDFDPDEWLKAQEMVFPEAPLGDDDAE